jgi:SanA protein
MLRREFKIIAQWLVIILILGVLILGLSRTITGLQAISRLYEVQNAPQKQVAIVFGAGLTRDGRPTSVLRDRVEAAANLYFAGKVEKILMSGDNRFSDYNEPGAMRAYALSLGVPDHAIVLDYAGRRTYDTCYRAKAIFRVQQALLVTQNFHLPRALYLCNALGIQADGVSADLHPYRRSAQFIWNLRELPASLTALLDVHFRHPIPVLGKPEPIFPSISEAQ